MPVRDFLFLVEGYLAKCGLEIDRDFNVSLNLINLAMGYKTDF